MAEKQMKLIINGYAYQMVQDTSTGELRIDSFQKHTIAQKAVEYVKAEVSRVAGPTSLEVAQGRRAECEGCESCKKTDEDNWYCKSCGCPEWERSRLQVKWEMPGATCPLGKWKG
jgi:hypothetical protein